jgi:hypothetical protein
MINNAESGVKNNSAKVVGCVRRDQNCVPLLTA